MKPIYCLLFSFFTTAFYAQKTFTVYFDTDSHQLSLSELKRLDENFKDKHVNVLSVIGFCDHRATTEHNDALAQNRAKFVGHLLEKLVNASKYEVLSKGENFEQHKDLSKNRKVEIMYQDIIVKDVPVETPKAKELTNNIKASKIGDKLVLKNMNFYDRMDVLYPESMPIREELLQSLIDNPKLKIEIQGHICCFLGKDNEEIALKRCVAIRNYLTLKGIDKSRISYKSFDATQPIYPIPEKNEEQKKANRRVEILILDK